LLRVITGEAMAHPKFRRSPIATSAGDADLLEFEIPGAVTHPAEFAAAVEDLPSTDRSVILSGRGPVWGFGMLVAWHSNAPWVATFEPRMNAAVVVRTSDPNLSVGATVSLAGVI
jgi:CRISPR-associated protein Csx3